MLAYSGDTLSVRKMVAAIEKRNTEPYDYGFKSYYTGILYALINEKEGAMNKLIQSYNEGWEFSYGAFRDDFRLKAMFDYPPFIEFTTPSNEDDDE